MIAVIQFPGSNCEYETARSCRAAGLTADILPWNCDPQTFGRYAGYILPGGFSFQDRVRAGAIAAKLPIIQLLLDADSQGKPILGICNGCQILAETGLVPNTSGKNELEMALTPNRLGDEAIGFICDWVFVEVQRPEANLFTRLLKPGAALPIPINHGEGRFVISEKAAAQLSVVSVLHYCDSEGTVSPDFPVTRNGSWNGLAGVGNAKGNVFAMMPHPERATFLKQIPAWLPSTWADSKLAAAGQYALAAGGPWFPLFQALKAAVTEEAVSHV